MDQPKIDLRPDHWVIVRDILRRHVPDRAVWAFGSRATWTAKEHSDLDLAILGDSPLPLAEVAALEEAFAESDLPFKVDVVDWHATSSAFQVVISDNHVQVQDPLHAYHPNRIKHQVSDLLAAGSLSIGDGYRAKNDELSNQGLPFARAGNVNEGFHFAGADRFPESSLYRVGNKVSLPGDVVFTSKGTVGRFAFVREETPQFVYSPQLCYWRSLDRSLIDPRYLYYWLSGPEFRDQFKSVSGQTDMAEYVSLTDQRRMNITLPPLSDQRAIAHILGTLDDKIDLNRRMNATLEAMARALFKSWFVDFDPVRAKAAGRDTGLPPEIAALFPDSFEESELGEVPRGWSLEPLVDHFEAVKGVSYKGSGLGDNGMPLHNLNSIYEGGGYKFEGIKHYSGEFAERHIVLPGDVIVANTEQGHDRLLIGYAALVPVAFGGRGIASHHLFRLRPRAQTPMTAAYICWLLNSPQMHGVVSGYANGTTVNMLPIDGVQKPMVLIPPRGLILAFDSIAMRTMRRREQSISESRVLTAIRDELLPKLVSGELHVSNTNSTMSTIGRSPGEEARAEAYRRHLRPNDRYWRG